MEKIIRRQEIKERLKTVFEKRLQIKLEDFGSDIFDCHFFSYKLGIAPRHLIYLFFDIEKEFQMEIPQEDINVGKFSTFNNIVDIIYQQLQISEDKVS